MTLNQVFEFLGNNSGLVITLLCSLVGLFSALISRKKQQIYATIPDLISTAQALELANNDKFQYVLDLAYKLVPNFFKLFISEKDIARAIEFSLNKLKDFAKEQAKASAIKSTSTTAEQNIAGNNVTGTQQAAEVSNNTSQE